MATISTQNLDLLRLANAVSLDTTVLMGSYMLGPLLGGSLISLVGYGGSYAVIVAMYLVGFTLLLSLGSGEVPTAPMPAGSVAIQLVEAAQVVRANRTIWAVLMVTVSLNLFGYPYM